MASELRCDVTDGGALVAFPLGVSVTFGGELASTAIGSDLQESTSGYDFSRWTAALASCLAVRLLLAFEIDTEFNVELEAEGRLVTP